MNILKKQFLFFLFLIIFYTVKAQEKTIEIISANKYAISNTDSLNSYYIFTGDVILKDKNTFFKTDSAVLNVKTNVLEAFKYINIDDGDSIHIKALYLKYYGNTKKAILRNKVKLTDKVSTLITDSLDYNLKTKIAIYKKGGKLLKNKTTIKSEDAVYDEKTKDIEFTKNVIVNDNADKIYSDHLNYNTKTQIVHFNTYTRIIQKTREIFTDSATYNFSNKTGHFFTRTFITDSTYDLISDKMDMNDSTTEYANYGNVIYTQKDSNHFELHGDTVLTNSTLKKLFATGNPWFKICKNLDTLYVSANIIKSNKLTNSNLLNNIENRRIDTQAVFTIDTNKQQYFEAYNNVKIFSDSLQAICDSLLYSQHDSVCRMIGNPVLWLKNNQITGDTMFVFQSNQQLEQLQVKDHAFIINTIDSTAYYNQIKGSNMFFYFVENEIDKIFIKGNAENIYYLQDDFKKFIGVNKSTSQQINLFFNKRAPTKIKYIKSVKGSTYPLSKFNKQESILRGFNILENKRPKHWTDILNTKKTY